MDAATSGGRSRLPPPAEWIPADALDVRSRPHWITARTTYYDHPLRRSLWRAGHAHAGVLLIRSVVALLLVDHADLSASWKQVVRTTFPAAALLLPIAYFLSIVRADGERPNRLVNLAYIGGLALTVGMVTLGIGLLQAG